MKKLTLLILVSLGCMKNYYPGTIHVNVGADRGFDTKLAAQLAADEWVRCGYGTSLPNDIFITEANLNQNHNAKETICARAELEGNRIAIDTTYCKDNPIDIIGHEMLHLIGFSHEDPFDYCNFNRILSACGFDITRSGPTDCRGF